ncbi:hypothetical protein [Mucilaginibacter sp. AK015]|uniref:hypothetical protein n=1 Tax=Mucilaginibacter sp. AK015 TaxID=2723072 RepID=UPI00160F6AD1|nr:hypothetical protein [Mucilaginibacter sp. AK015]MBB5397169.1 ABC-type amino acid transport system permease subunit [Mucilaginibacter sp. AK015]
MGDLIKLKFEIYFTNWINVLGIAACTYLYVLISELFVTGISAFPQMLLMALFTIALYGGTFFLGFLICMLLLDMVLMDGYIKHLRVRLFIEWLFISTPLIYWVIVYKEWVFVIGVLAFMGTQLIREERISTIIKRREHVQ